MKYLILLIFCCFSAYAYEEYIPDNKDTSFLNKCYKEFNDSNSVFKAVEYNSPQVKLYQYRKKMNAIFLLEDVPIQNNEGEHSWEFYSIKQISYSTFSTQYIKASCI